MVQLAKDVIPSLSVQNTDAQLANQGYTYNQPGFSFDQVGVMYGGVYEAGEDIFPLFSYAKDVIPALATITDAYLPGIVVNLPKGMPMAPGFFLYIPYPVAVNIVTHQ